MEHDEMVKSFQMVEFVQGGGKEPAEEAPPHDCDALQREAFEQGRQAGIEEGRAQCQAEVEEELKKALRLANHIGRARVAALEEHERDIVEVALAITRKIILREIEIDKEIVVRQVRQVLELLPAQELVTLKVHPQDFRTLEPLQHTLRAEFSKGDHLVLESHEDVDPGGCLVEQAGLLFDAQLTQQLAIVASEFGLESSRS
ncbi:MAG: FliH/SctL family protein [Nitrospirota bacterium]|jgi:flagellar assembly protein FliH|nr:FliH/SctL family protein [Nitrospirota bacterium]MDH4361253.1 FliH/SctL family protein [Nitrospirota bacterium]MDH5295767.1 FliH/SctL family protein [Nitrospirota bacterium]